MPKPANPTHCIRCHTAGPRICAGCAAVLAGEIEAAHKEISRGWLRMLASFLMDALMPSWAALFVPEDERLPFDAERDNQ